MDLDWVALWDPATAAASLAGVLALQWLAHSQRARRLERGVTAQAVVVAVEDTGVRVDDRPYFRLALRVERARGHPRESARPLDITHGCTVPARTRRPAAGAVVRVTYDPCDPSHLRIDWHR